MGNSLLKRTLDNENGLPANDRVVSLTTYARISLMIAVVEKCKENKEEARFLLESASLEGFYNVDYFVCWSGKQI